MRRAAVLALALAAAPACKRDQAPPAAGSGSAIPPIVVLDAGPTTDSVVGEAPAPLVPGAIKPEDDQLLTDVVEGTVQISLASLKIVEAAGTDCKQATIQLKTLEPQAEHMREIGATFAARNQDNPLLDVERKRRMKIYAQSHADEIATLTKSARAIMDACKDDQDFMATLQSLEFLRPKAPKHPAGAPAPTGAGSAAPATP